MIVSIPSLPPGNQFLLGRLKVAVFACRFLLGQTAGFKKQNNLNAMLF